MIETYEVPVKCENCNNTGVLEVPQGLDFEPSNLFMTARIGNFPTKMKPVCPKCGSGKLKRNSSSQSGFKWK